MRLRTPRVYPYSFNLSGGMDLITPQLSMAPGRVIGGTNYENLTEGGYQRVGGYERFDGRPRPSDAVYTALLATTTFDVSVVDGDTITGATSGATGVVCYLAADRTYVAVTKVTGTFVLGEVLNKGVTAVATLSPSQPSINRTLDNTIKAAAATKYAADIGTVPGSGDVRGVFSLKDNVYAWRDNAGSTACVLYKATSGGWTLVPLGIELKFTLGNTGTAIAEGNTVVGATSGATGVVTRVATRTGSWTAGNPASGSLYFATVTGTFAAGEGIKVGATALATAGSGTPQSNCTLLPGGRFETENYNFTGSADTLRTYGCDGKNRAWEFDGSVFAFITTGMTTDTPSFVVAHKNMLFLAFRGSVQYSSIGTPFTWSPIVGSSGEIGAGDTVTGMVSVGGVQLGAALMVFCKNRTWVLYGNSSADFNFVPLSPTSGSLPYTLQLIGVPVYLNDIGITTSTNVQAFANFQSATISEAVRPLLKQKSGLSVASTVVRMKNQYKLFFSDKTGLTITFRGAELAGILPFTYQHQTTCITNTQIAGIERVFFGASDGYIYEMNRGRTFGGNAIEAYLRTSFNNLKNPSLRKMFKWGTVDGASESGATLSITPEFSYASSDIPAAGTSALLFAGSGARWGEMIWGQFFWGEPDFTPARLRADGEGINVSLIFYHNSSTELTHTIQSATLHYIPRRQER